MPLDAANQEFFILYVCRTLDYERKACNDGCCGSSHLKRQGTGTLVKLYCNYLACALAFLLAAPSISRGDEPFVGWRGMRVVELKGQPGRAFVDDLNGGGGDELIVINTRQARLEIYHWLASNREASAAESTQPSDASASASSASEASSESTDAPALATRFSGGVDDPNMLPMAANLAMDMVQLEQVPMDAVAVDLDGDGQKELLILTQPTLRVEAFELTNTGWVKRQTWPLLRGSLSGQQGFMAVRETAGKTGQSRELLISMDEGFQRLPLDDSKLNAGEEAAPGQAAWLSPRDRAGRLDWRLADLDGDGGLDLVEWTRLPRQSVRWRRSADGRLLPPEPLREEMLRGVAIAAGPSQKTEVLALDPQTRNQLRRMAVRDAQASPIGLRHTLPIDKAMQSAWCTATLGGESALVAIDPEQPRALVYRYTADGWSPAATFPVVSDVQQIQSPYPDTLLMVTKDAANIHLSVWDNHRLTYPRPMPDFVGKSAGVVAMGGTQAAVWWVRKVASDSDVFMLDIWQRGQGMGGGFRSVPLTLPADTDRVQWIGGDRILLRQKFKRDAILAELKPKADGAGMETVLIDSPAVTRAFNADVQLFGDADHLRLAQLKDGVLQWLDTDLNPVDQVMLPAGKRLVSFVPQDATNPMSSAAWALEAGGEQIHELKPDAAGVMRVSASWAAPGGIALRQDPVLGLILLSNDTLTVLKPGSRGELTLIQSLDNPMERALAASESEVSRVMTTDVTGDGREDVLILDDQRHEVMVLRDKDGLLAPLASWRIFDDHSYPYGGGGMTLDGAGSAEPRDIDGLDIDGDGVQDLAMLCHDRLLIYTSQP